MASSTPLAISNRLPGPEEIDQWRLLVWQLGTRRLFVNEMGPYTVSTVMVDLGEPLLGSAVNFETMVFYELQRGGRAVAYRDVCFWWREAAHQHRHALSWVREQQDILASQQEATDYRGEVEC